MGIDVGGKANKYTEPRSAHQTASNKRRRASSSGTPVSDKYGGVHLTLSTTKWPKPKSIFFLLKKKDNLGSSKPRERDLRRMILYTTNHMVPDTWVIWHHDFTPRTQSQRHGQTEIEREVQSNHSSSNSFKNLWWKPKNKNQIILQTTKESQLFCFDATRCRRCFRVKVLFLCGTRMSDSGPGVLSLSPFIFIYLKLYNTIIIFLNYYSFGEAMFTKVFLQMG